MPEPSMPEPIRSIAWPSPVRPALGALAQARSWIEIDLAALADNLRAIRTLIRPARLLFTVKKDAYGHGLLPAARTARQLGVDYLGVACLAEALSLRAAGIRTPILHLGAAVPEELEAAVRHDVDLTVSTLEEARRLALIARRAERRARAHLKVDTGMGRLGLRPEQLVDQIDDLAGLAEIEWIGLYSHLADCPGNPALTDQQLEQFRCVADATADWLRLRHLGASGALADRRLHFDMLRVGIAAYGGDPLRPECGPVMSLKSRLLFIKDCPAGQPISYGATHVTSQATRVGVVAAGYGNGYPRLLSGRGGVLVGGRLAPILGRVCMDQFMIDLNNHPGARVGDTVLLFGRDGAHYLPAAKVAVWAETISYELFCTAGMMNARTYGSAAPVAKTPTPEPA